MTSRPTQRQRSVNQIGEQSTATIVLNRKERVVKDNTDTKRQSGVKPDSLTDSKNTIRIKRPVSSTPKVEDRGGSKLFTRVGNVSAEWEEDKGKVVSDGKKIKPGSSRSPTLERKPKRSQSQVNASTTQIANRAKTRPRDEDEDWDPNDIPSKIPKSKRELVSMTPRPVRTRPNYDEDEDWDPNDIQSTIPRSKRELVTATPPPARPQGARITRSSIPGQRRMVPAHRITTPRLSVPSHVPGSVEPRDSLQPPVLIPGSASANPLVVKEEDEDDGITISERLINPNVKVEKQEFDVDTVGARLFSIGFYPDPITLDKPTQNQAFDRDFIQSKYGGGHQDSVPTIGKKYYEKTGLKRFVYLNKVYQPLAPENAGDPGMYFDTPDFEGKVPCEETVVFTRFEANKWCYMGLYEMKAAPPLTKEEWGQQSKEVQDTWASKICRDPGENSKYNWGGLVRSRIHLRETLEREPESDEVTKAAEKRLYKSITKEDVKKAYLNGTEKIIVWTLKCVGYDPALQQDLIKRSRTWSPPPPKGKRKAKGNDDNDKTGPTRKKRRVVKKERVKVKSEMSSEAERSENYDNSDFMDVDSEEGVEPVYHPRVTRSRRKARALSPEV